MEKYSTKKLGFFLILILGIIYLFYIYTNTTAVEDYSTLQSLVITLLLILVCFLFYKIETKNKSLKQKSEDLKIVGQQLKNTETKLNEVFKNSQDVFYKAKLDGTILELSDSVENFIDYKAEELLGTNVNDLYYDSNDRKKLLEIMNKQGTVMDYEINMKFKDDKIKHVLLNSTLVLDSNKHPLYIKGALKDITERRIAEEKVLESENLLRTIINNQPDCIKIVDIDGNLVMMNPAGLEMIEADSLEQVKGLHISDLIMPDFTKVYNDLHRNVIQGNYGKLEFQVQGLKGTKRWMKTSAVPIILQGKTVYLAHTRDISESKIAEQRLEKSEQFLKESQKIGHIGTYEVNLKTGTCQSSEVLNEILGIDNNFVKNLDNWESILHPEWKEIMLDYLTNEVIGQKKDFNKKYKIIRINDGAKRWVHGQGKLYLDPSGVPYRLAGVIQDITDQKEKEKELRNSKEKAEESERLKSAFLANMSHEIRTPMNGILGFTELLKEPNLSGEKQAEYIEIIRKSGNRMLNIINDIIDISKIESGLMNVNNMQTNVNEINEYIYAFFKHEAFNEGIKFSFKNDLGNDDAFINSDKQKINNILINLVKNAIKFTNKGEIEFGYRLKPIDENSVSTSDCRELEFYVRDTGNGIAKDQLKIVFERFRQTSESTAKNYEGAGLGLAITKSFVEMLGGKIWVKSKLGKGSTFYFTLPYNPNPKEIKIAKVDHTTTVGQEQILDLKILIAEDDEISAKLLNLTIKGIAKTVVRARNGIEAVDLARNNPDIDLILMDVQMPLMDGYEAMAEIRKFNPEVIIIAQTAFALAEDIQKTVNAGCNGYTSKPVRKVELLKLVDKYFNDRIPAPID